VYCRARTYINPVGKETSNTEGEGNLEKKKKKKEGKEKIDVPDQSGWLEGGAYKGLIKSFAHYFQNMRKGARKKGRSERRAGRKWGRDDSLGKTDVQAQVLRRQEIIKKKWDGHADEGHENKEGLTER